MMPIISKHQTILASELVKYSFYGNIRELQNIAERFSIMVDPNYINNPAHLVNVLEESLTDSRMNSNVGGDNSDETITVSLNNNLKTSIKDAEKAILQLALKRNKNNRSELAKALGIKRETLWRKFKEHDL